MYQLPPPMNVPMPAGWQPIVPAVAPLTHAELDQLKPIVMNQYINMTPDQQNNMENQWNIAVIGYPNMRISSKPSGDGGITKNIAIRRQIANNRFSPSVLLFNTRDIVKPDLPVQEPLGGRKSRRRKSRRSKSRRRKSRRRI
jgi:hypothetical protein